MFDDYIVPFLRLKYYICSKKIKSLEILYV